MQRQENKLSHIPEPEWIKWTCESCGGDQGKSNCWRYKGETGECWYPPGSVKIVAEEPIHEHLN